MSAVSNVLRSIETGYAAYCPGCKSVHVFDSRWRGQGLETDHPTFTPSLLVTCPGDHDNPDYPLPPERCHSFLTNGRWQFLGDSTHALAGQTVDMVPVEQWYQSL